MYNSSINTISQWNRVTKALYTTGIQYCIQTRNFSSKHQQSKNDTSNNANNIYQNYLNLPETDFPMRPIGGSAASEALYRPYCTEILYDWQTNPENDQIRNTLKGGVAPKPDNSRPTFIIHDGPPFANGPLHTGHFLNKTLKDIINRYKVLRGHRVHFYHGWDCHGLPIEHKALSSFTDSTSDSTTTTSSKDTTTSKKKSSSFNPKAHSVFKVREIAEQFAHDAMVNQKKDLQNWGVLGDWSNPYITMAPEYEAIQLDVFSSLVEKGLIFRSKMPVHWSPSSGTALAEAELEYDNHTSLAAHIGFPLSLQNIQDNHESIEKLANATSMSTQRLEELIQSQNLMYLIWTTTPWTLPANRAIAFSDTAEYVIVRVQREDITHSVQDNSTIATETVIDSYYILAKDLLPLLEENFEKTIASSTAKYNSACQALIKQQKKLASKQSSSSSSPTDNSTVISNETFIIPKYTMTVESTPFTGDNLNTMTYTHPLIQADDNLASYLSDCYTLPAFSADYVTTESGSGLVHTAPGHGMDDFLATRPLNIPVACPVDEQGCFTAELGTSLEGIEVLSGGSEKVLDILRSLDSKYVLVANKYEHRYPFDWRTRQPVIFRATSQWFCKVESIRDEAVSSLDDVTFIPAVAKNRLASYVSGRDQWCISRQRSWGMPIPVFYHKDTDDVLIQSDIVQYIANIFSKYGSQAWWSFPTWRLLPPQYRGKQVRQDVDLQSTNSADEDAFECIYNRGFDTMDVWLDSGSSWKSAIEARGHTTPVDIYIEGSDQHRGWFQSSLLTSIALKHTAPYKTLISHGFVVDDEGKKMSKSLGNGVEPNLLIHGISTASTTSTADSTTSGQKKKKTKVDQFYEKFPNGTGVDTLRMWAGSVDYTSDATFSPILVTIAQDTIRKWRSSVRYILGCIESNTDADTDTDATTTTKDTNKTDTNTTTHPQMKNVPFNPFTDRVVYEDLLPVDKYFLHELAIFQRNVTEAYDSYTFVKALSIIRHFVSSTFSAFYADSCKDRLYSDEIDSLSRKSCLTVLTATLETLVKVVAPITPHVVEEIYQYLDPVFKSYFASPVSHESNESPTSIPTGSSNLSSVFMTGWVDAPSQWINPEIASQWSKIKAIRGAISKTTEKYKEIQRSFDILETTTSEDTNGKGKGKKISEDLELLLQQCKESNIPSLPRIGASQESETLIELLHEPDFMTTCSRDSAIDLYQTCHSIQSKSTQNSAFADALLVSGATVVMQQTEKTETAPYTTVGTITVGTMNNLAKTPYVQWTGLIEYDNLIGVKTLAPVRITISHSSGCKCPRCWRYSVVSERDTLHVTKSNCNWINTTEDGKEKKFEFSSFVRASPMDHSVNVGEGLCGRCTDALCHQYHM